MDDPKLHAYVKTLKTPLKALKNGVIQDAEGNMLFRAVYASEEMMALLVRMPELIQQSSALHAADVWDDVADDIEDTTTPGRNT